MDQYDEHKAESYRQEREDDTLKMLFVGSSFFANNDGVQWFLDNVFPKIGNAHFTIVGKGMDSVFSSRKNIEVKGFVPNLSAYYYSADVVVVPIFHGGMKTKTAEALMYGSSVVGTTKAFEGYDIDFNRIGGRANTLEEMVDRINRLKDSEFADACRVYSRAVFVKNTALKARLIQLSKIYYEENPFGLRHTPGGDQDGSAGQGIPEARDRVRGGWNTTSTTWSTDRGSWTARCWPRPSLASSWKEVLK